MEPIKPFAVSNARPFKHEDNSRWQGPSFALSANLAEEALLALGGYRYRHASWEKRVGPGEPAQAPWGDACIAWGSLGLLKQLNRCSSVEIEWITDAHTEQEQSAISGTLSAVIGDALAAGWRELPEIGSQSVSANRHPDVPDSWSKAGLSFCDLRFTALPTRQRDESVPLCYGTRWVRIVRSPRVFGAFWSPIQGNWIESAIRWPHHAIPSRSEIWLRRNALSPSATADERVKAFLIDCLEHELYFIDGNFEIEFETWEQRLFKNLTSPTNAYAKLDLPGTQQELGLLADYAADVRFDIRALARQSRTNPAIATLRNDENITTALDSLHVIIARQRERVRNGFALVSSVGTGQILWTSQQAQHTNQRMQDFLSALTAVFLVPSAVISFYGSNLRELSTGATGSIPALSAYVISTALGTWTLTQCITRRPLLPFTKPGAAFAAACVAIVALSALGITIYLLHDWFALAAEAIATAFAGAVLTARRVKRINEKGALVSPAHEIT